VTDDGVVGKGKEGIYVSSPDEVVMLVPVSVFSVVVVESHVSFRIQPSTGDGEDSN